MYEGTYEVQYQAIKLAGDVVFGEGALHLPAHNFLVHETSPL